VTSAFPGVSIQTILASVEAGTTAFVFPKETSNPPLYLIKVEPDQKSVNEVLPATQPVDPGSTSDRVSVKVYQLGDIVKYQALGKQGTGDHAQEAMDDVLSLLQAALDQMGGKTQATMKVHRQTLALIFKGTRDQAELMDQTLATIRSMNGEMENNSLQMVEKATADLQEAESQNTALREELNERSKTTQPAK
jgi:hypothetical protein